jgi:colicin import membrane protein
MAWKLSAPVTVALFCGSLFAAGAAEEKSANPAPAIAAKDLTREQFQALPPEAAIEINGERIAKSTFQARNRKAVEEAVKRLPELRARERAESEARRKALLDKRGAALAEANKKAEAEIAKLVAADATKHGPNWEARKKQAADLLERAANASPIERSELEKQAEDLVAPSAK